MIPDEFTEQDACSAEIEASSTPGGIDQFTTTELGKTTFVFGYVEESLVQEFLHASDGFQFLLAISLTGAGASADAFVALGAGALHPVAMYLSLCGLLAVTAVTGGMTVREYLRTRRVRSRLSAATVRVPVPLMLVTPGSPSFTMAVSAVGGKSEGEIAQGLAGSIASQQRSGPQVVQDIEPYNKEARSTPPSRGHAAAVWRGRAKFLRLRAGQRSGRGADSPDR
jgi:hypothetical protein